MVMDKLVLYHKAGELEIAQTYSQIDWHYAKGKRVKRDRKKAIEYYKKAAENGC